MILKLQYFRQLAGYTFNGIPSLGITKVGYLHIKSDSISFVCEQYTNLYISG